MSKRIAIMAVVAVIAGAVFGADEAWMTDFEAAKKRAAELGRPILADFSGSDWCGWCMRLEREVFSTPEFKEYAKNNLILFVADFPKAREQSAKIVAQNRALMTRYGVGGFPTVLVLDAGGGVLAVTGYRRGGAESYIDHLRQAIAAAEKKARQSSGPELDQKGQGGLRSQPNGPAALALRRPQYTGTQTRRCIPLFPPSALLKPET